MKVHLVDGTYELFRTYYGTQPSTSPDGLEVGATRGLLATLLKLLRQDDVSHVACAFDHVIESFRNDLYPGYKTGEGIEPALLAQFELAERATHALGMVVWSMVEFEADDALAAGAARFRIDERVEQVVICSPDKDLTQCVIGSEVVCLDRRRDILLEDAGVRSKFGVAPASIPDWLALVGDNADGFKGIPGWGKKTAAILLAHYGRLEAIPDDPGEWAVKVRGAARLAETLRSERDAASLYKELATLRVDVPLRETLDDLEWRGARREELDRLCREIGEGDVMDRIAKWR